MKRACLFALLIGLNTVGIDLTAWKTPFSHALSKCVAGHLVMMNWLGRDISQSQPERNGKQQRPTEHDAKRRARMPCADGRIALLFGRSRSEGRNDAKRQPLQCD